MVMKSKWVVRFNTHSKSFDERETAEDFVIGNKLTGTITLRMKFPSGKTKQKLNSKWILGEIRND